MAYRYFLMIALLFSVSSVPIGCASNHKIDEFEKTKYLRPQTSKKELIDQFRKTFQNRCLYTNVGICRSKVLKVYDDSFSYQSSQNSTYIIYFDSNLEFSNTGELCFDKAAYLNPKVSLNKKFKTHRCVAFNNKDDALRMFGLIKSFQEAE